LFLFLLLIFAFVAGDYAVTDVHDAVGSIISPFGLRSGQALRAGKVG
jgi:hypothetical protein